jgi:enoyl-CoA hydratase
MSDYETLLLATDGPIATITLNRPAVLNALNATLFRELDEACSDFATDSSIRVILITGAGPKAFAAGADIVELSKTDAESGEALSRRGQNVFSRISTCGKPVIACINGFALGGGCELALACTFRIASESARLGQPEVKLGLIPGYGGTQRLPRLVGPSAALRLILTGEMVSAQEALHIGLVDEVVPAEELLPRAKAFATQLASLAPIAINEAMRAVNYGANLPLPQALEVEAKLFGHLCDTSDKKEGVAAFLEKRAATFTGC